VSLYVALLRGINVGGKNKLPMKDLVAMFVAAGCGDVEAYIQSGNVVFRARPPVAAKVPAAIAGAILARSGYRIPVVMRTAGEVDDVANSNPFLATGQNPDTLHVAFLADKPKAGGVLALDARRSPPDEFVVRGREIFLRLLEAHERVFRLGPRDDVDHAKLADRPEASRAQRSLTSATW
jgi:uncharacterized protein (DUF1697 family)